MLYRPDHVLGRLREQRSTATLLLQWLRTLEIDCNEVPLDQRMMFVENTLAMQQRSVQPRAVNRVVLKTIPDAAATALQQHVQSLPLLTVLDLRGCFKESVKDSFLSAVGYFHHYLQRLLLPIASNVTQSTLDRFRQLVELEVSWCENITNVDFCSATLRALYADRCAKLTDAGLKNATRLEVLRVSSCKGVTSVSPFARSLVELDVSFNASMSPTALAECHNLQVLYVTANSTINTLQPFAGRLRELHVAGRGSKLDDAALVEATQLVKLQAQNNPRLTTVAPFGKTLIELDAIGDCGINDIGLATATNLVCLDASRNARIQNIQSCASTLVELSIKDSGIGQETVLHARNLIYVDISNNTAITTVAPFSASLRHLVACNDRTIGDAGLLSATRLVTLTCLDNPNITTIAFCADSLQELNAVGEHCGMRGSEIMAAPHLRKVNMRLNPNISHSHHLRGFHECRYGLYVRNEWTRQTFNPATAGQSSDPPSSGHSIDTLTFF